MTSEDEVAVVDLGKLEVVSELRTGVGPTATPGSGGSSEGRETRGPKGRMKGILWSLDARPDASVAESHCAVGSDSWAWR